MKRMLVILLVVGLLLGTVGAILCEDETPSGDLSTTTEWSDGSSPDTVPCGGGGGGGTGGIPG
jgi:hypothetical protein